MKSMSLLGLLLLLSSACGGSLGVAHDSVHDPVVTDTDTDTDTDADTGIEAGFPCDVRAVIETYCAKCHAGQYYTIAFLTPEIVRAYGEMMMNRMLDPVRPMPPIYEQARPTAGDIALIAAWLYAGGPEGDCGTIPHATH
jgi:hypothetical protein